MSHRIKIPYNFGDDVGIELKSSALAPTEIKCNFVFAFVLNSITKLDIISVGESAEDFSSISTSSSKLSGILIL